MNHFSNSRSFHGAGFRCFICEGSLPRTRANKKANAKLSDTQDSYSIHSCDANALPSCSKAGKEKVPDYAFDCHTLKGKRKGRTKADFFREQQRALNPGQPGLFDGLPES